MFHSTLKAAALIAGLVLPGAALAATSAVVTTDLNVRTGPSAAYQRYGTIPAGDEVTVYGCLSGYNWCDVDWAGGRGWVSGSYLAYLGRRYYRQPISTVGISIGVPVLGFDPYDYHRRYYTGRSWYHDRYLDRADRRDARGDWREGRRDGWREDSRDGWREGRDRGQDWREGRGNDGRDGRDGRRDGGDGRDARRDGDDGRRDGVRDGRDARGDGRREGRDDRPDRRIVIEGEGRSQARSHGDGGDGGDGQGRDFGGGPRRLIIGGDN